MRRRDRYTALALLLLLPLCLLYTASAQRFREEKRSGYRGGFNKQLQIPDKALSFLVLGDWGRNGEYYQQQVARQMSRAAATLDIGFVLTVGDNFYPNGVQSTSDHQWISSFEHIYTAHFLHCNWYVTLGNHDYRGNIQAQTGYSALSRRWQLPAPYYSRKIAINDSEQLLLVVMDTNPFIGSYYRKDDEIGRNVRAQDTSAQIAWLEKTLADTASSIKWKIVAGHHPLYSGGKRKTSTDTRWMEQRFRPFFDRLKVDAYVCGHEHDLQVIRPDGAYTLQLLSGAGCEVRPTGNTTGTLFAAALPGFMSFSLTGKQMLVQVIQANGKVCYRTTLNK